METARNPGWRDHAIAAGIALLLTLAWTVRDWAALSALRLPDTDDVMRLQQIRDWLAGQSFGDLAQHRLGIGGLEMHWSRLPDLIPGAIIAAFTPLIGGHAAEIAAVIAWPALLFAAALALSGSIARALHVSALVAIVVAALAYPASTLFVPGRIDHHGLQLVLVLALVRAVLGRGTWRSGAVAGLASVLSLVIGMEMAPLLAIGGGVILLRWLWREQGSQASLTGYGVALAGGLSIAALTLRSSGWTFPACDGFGAPLWRAAQVAAFVPLALGLASRWLPSVRARLVAALLLGSAAAGVILMLSPPCLRPYAAVDPLLARVWLAQVAEAQPLFGAPLAHAIGYGGLMLAGLLATAWMWRRSANRAWLVLGAFQIVSLAITLAQLRGAYAGAMLAAPALPGLIALARARGVLPLAAAWIAAAGFVYPMAGAALSPSAAPVAAAGAGCDPGPAIALLSRRPGGTLAAPIDFSAYALAATPHRVLAGPYHRNAAGNRAVYRLMLLPEPRAVVLARDLGVDYLADCHGAFAELGTPPAGSLLAQLRGGTVPVWLQPLTPRDAGMRVYRVGAAR